MKSLAAVDDADIRRTNNRNVKGEIAVAKSRCFLEAVIVSAAAAVSGAARFMPGAVF